MKVTLQYNYTDLAHLAPLFQELYERFPQGWIRFGGDDPEDACVLDVQPYRITREDRQFFDMLREKHLITSWVHHFSEGSIKKEVHMAELILNEQDIRQLLTILMVAQRDTTEKIRQATPETLPNLKAHRRAIDTWISKLSKIPDARRILEAEWEEGLDWFRE
jgi:hypothetical protein